MQRLERWQPVEIKLDDDTWMEARYVAPYDDKVSPLAHTVGVIDGGELTEAQVSDAEIRPVPCFLASGDDLRLIDAALTCREHELLRGEYEGRRAVSDGTLRVKDLRDRVRAAMGEMR